MEELPAVIEKLRKKGYFLYDILYEELDNPELSFDDGYISPNIETIRGHRKLARVLSRHMKGGIHIKPRVIYLALESKIRKSEEQDLGDNCRFCYPINANLQTKTITPFLEHRTIYNPSLVYEDITKEFRDSGWSVNLPS